MKTKEIKTISIESFKQNNYLLDYADNDFVIINSLEGTEVYSNDNAVRLDCLLITVCMEGHIQLDINLKTYQLQKGDVLLGLPGTFISHAMVSPRYKVKFIGFSTRFLQRIFKMERTTWNTAIHIHNNPVIKNAGDETPTKAFELYRDLIMTKLDEGNQHSYHRDAVRYLFSALLCEVMGKMEQMSAVRESASDTENIKLKDHILRRFMQLLSEDNGMHRSVSYFANELCYTPKYLSQIVRQACGKTPLELINESVIEHIKYRLKRSDKSIKEIAEEFDFPNQSFFGKYVKAHLGMTPVSYRNSLTED